MIEATGNLWTYPADFRVITTNGTVRKDGACVMGRGCAKEAAGMYPDLPMVLGDHIRRHGNVVRYFADYQLFSFPVKHAWYEPADPLLIRRSVDAFKRQLLASATYVMPRPGCGNGQLHWDMVAPLLLDLPDNVVVITFA